MTAAAVALLALALALAGPATARAQKVVTIGSNPPGSVFHAVASGLVKLAGETGVARATVQPYAGSSTFLPLLESGELDFGVNTALDAALSYRGPTFTVGGRNPFPHAPSMRLLMLGPRLTAAPLVRKDSPIRTMRDVRGKRVTGEYPASVSTWYTIFGSLQSAGLSWSDVQVVPVPGLPEGIDALVQRRADVSLFALNGAKVREADAAVGVRHLSLDCSPEGAGRVRAALPGYFVHPVKRGEAAAVVEDICAVAFHIYFTAGKGVTDDLAEALMRAMWDQGGRLASVHPIFKDWAHDRLPSLDVAVPYHPGAVRFLRSRGLWTADMERIQQQLLAAPRR